MNSPAVGRPSAWAGVPELSLQQQTARRLEAAQVRLPGGVVARCLAGRAAAGAHALEEVQGADRGDEGRRRRSADKGSKDNWKHYLWARW